VDVAERPDAWSRYHQITRLAAHLGWEPSPRKDHYWHLPGTNWVLRVTLQEIVLYRWLKRRAATSQRRFLPTQVREITAHLTQITEAERTPQEVS
jgi:hypothetical protein